MFYWKKMRSNVLRYLIRCGMRPYGKLSPGHNQESESDANTLIVTETRSNSGSTYSTCMR